MTENYKILVADDEPDIIIITKMVLKSLQINGKHCEVIEANSGLQAVNALKKNEHIAVAILDVVMEDKQSGFEVANYIRNQLNSHNIQIIFRSGMPGGIPEMLMPSLFKNDIWLSKVECNSNVLKTQVCDAIQRFECV